MGASDGGKVDAKRKIMKNKNKKLITESHISEHPTLYMVIINLGGLYEKVIILNNTDDEDNMWVDKSGDHCFYPGERYFGWNVDPTGRVEYITPTKDEAEKVLNAILVYREFLKERL
jgi:hypothetical protein